MLLARAQQKHETKQTPTSPKDPPAGYKEKNLHHGDGQTLVCAQRDGGISVLVQCSTEISLVLSKGWN